MDPIFDKKILCVFSPSFFVSVSESRKHSAEAMG